MFSLVPNGRMSSFKDINLILCSSAPKPKKETPSETKKATTPDSHYTQLFHAFKLALENAILRYKNSFTCEPMPLHRTRDVEAINALLVASEFETAPLGSQLLKDRIKKEMDRFHTGFLGRSSLKRELETILNHEEYQDNRFLMAYFQDISPTLVNLEKLQKEILHLKSENLRLQTENQMLRQKLRQFEKGADKNRQSLELLDNETQSDEEFKHIGGSGSDTDTKSFFQKR